MVKAVNMDESPNTSGKPPKKSSENDLSILNPEDDVEFDIDFSNDTEILDAVSDKAKGGTELMKKWLFNEMEKQEPGLKDKFQFISTRVRGLESDKQRILWVHDLAGDPEVQHLKDKENWEKFERIVFVSHWQQHQFKTHLGFPYEKGVVIQNAIYPIPEHKKTKDGKIQVCYFSTPHRGLEVLLNAWEFMRDKLKDGFNDLARIHNISDFVECVGYPCRSVVTFNSNDIFDNLEMKSWFQQELMRRGILWTAYHAICFSHKHQHIDYTLNCLDEIFPIFQDIIEKKKSLRSLIEGIPVRPVFRKVADFNAYIQKDI